MPCIQAAQGRLDGLAPSDSCCAALGEWPRILGFCEQAEPDAAPTCESNVVPTGWDSMRRRIFGLNRGKNQSKDPETSDAADRIRSERNMPRLCFVFPSCVDSRVRSMKTRCILWLSLVRHAVRRLKLSTNYFPAAMENLNIVDHVVEGRRGAPGSHELFSGHKSVR